MGIFDSFFGDKKTQTTNNTQSGTSNFGLTPAVQDYWKSISGMFGPNTWNPVGPNQYQTQAAGTQAGLGTSLMPAYGAAGGIATGGIDPNRIKDFMSPYTQDVINTSIKGVRDEAANTGALSNASAAKMGALGGTGGINRRLIQDSNTNDLIAKTTAGLNNQNYAQASGMATQDVNARLGGIGAMNSTVGNMAGINQGLFGMGSQFYNQQFQNQMMPYQLAQMGTQTLAGLSPFSGTSSTGTSAGTATTMGTPSPFSIGMNIAGLGASLFSDERVKENIHPIGETYDGQPIYKYNYKGTPTTQIGLMAQDVEQNKPEAVGSVAGIKTVDYDKATKGAERSMADGGGVGMEPFKSDSHERFVKAFDTISGLMTRARGGAVGKADGGPIGSWSTTVTPAPDYKAMGDKMQKMGQSQPMGDDNALAQSQASLSQFMSGLTPRPQYDAGGSVSWGETGPVFPTSGIEPPSFLGAGPAPASRSALLPPRMSNVPMTDDDLRAPAPSGEVTLASGRGTVPRSGAAPEGDSLLTRILPGLKEGIWAGQKATPTQRFGAALMSIRGPMFEGPLNGVARNIMEWDASRRSERQIDNEVARMLGEIDGRPTLEAQRLQQHAAEVAAQMKHNRDVALGKIDGQPTVAARAQDRADASTAIADDLNREKLEGVRNPQIAVTRRAELAAGIGLKKGDPGYDHFVLTGELPQRTAAGDTIKEVNGKLVRVPQQGPGQVIFDAGPDFSKLPEYAAKSAAFASRMVDAEQNMRASMADKEKFDPTAGHVGVVNNWVPEGLANYAIRGDDWQKYMQSAEQWIRAFLRKESGAAIGKDEFARDFKVYFPQPGDKPETVKQKAMARINAVRGFAEETRGYFDHAHAPQKRMVDEWAGQASGKYQDRAPGAPEGAPQDISRPLPRITTDAEYDALKPGTKFVDPNGKTRTKP